MAKSSKVAPAPAAVPAQNMPMFYKKVVALNREQHRNLYVDAEPGFKFAKDTNCVYVAAVEFAPASREYPIVFSRTENNSLFPVALLGVRNNQNLYLGSDGQWQAKYIPAYVRRYPFILAADNSGDRFTVCIDEGYPGFNTAKEGEPLLTENGEEGPLLKRSVEFLKDYLAQVARTTMFCDTLRDLNILEPVQANIELKSGEKLAVGGFLCVNRNKLRMLPDAELVSLVKREYLELIYLHLQSLLSLNYLLGLAAP